MVLAPNDLFSWNKNTVRYGLWWGYIIYIMLLICTMHNSTHSAHNCLLTPWQGCLLCPRSSCYVFPPPLSGTNYCSLYTYRGLLPPRGRPFSQDPRTLPPHSSEHSLPHGESNPMVCCVTPIPPGNLILQCAVHLVPPSSGSYGALCTPWPQRRYFDFIWESSTALPLGAITLKRKRLLPKVFT